jgi:group I intron endonuclease
MKSGIYKIVSKINNKFYIGSAKDINKRWKRHIRDLKNKRHINQHLQRCYDKYGEDNFSFEIVEICNKEELLIKEQYYLDSLKAYEVGFNIGKNASGGDNLTNNPNRENIIERMKKTLKENIENMSEEERKEKWGRYGKDNPNYGKKMSNELKEIIKKANKGRSPINKGKTNEELYGVERSKEISKKLSEHASKRKGEKNPFYNKKHSDEVKEKIGKANKGRKPKNRIKLSIDDKIFDSYHDASKELGISYVTIRWRCLSNNSKFENYKLI